MKTTLFGSRLTQVFVDVLPKSTLTIDFIRLLVGLVFIGVVADFTEFIGVAAEFIGVAAEFIGVAAEFIGVAAEFIGVAADGWTVMKAPNLT
jgi:hypothetical protein